MKSKRFRAGGLLAAGALAGAVLAGTVGANDATGSSATTAPAYGSGASGASGAAAASGHNPNETVLTGTAATKARAAALKAVPGGTIDRVETDGGDATYEAHMTKADGTQVTVKLDKDFAVTAVEAGMGT